MTYFQILKEQLFYFYGCKEGGLDKKKLFSCFFVLKKNMLADVYLEL